MSKSATNNQNSSWDQQVLIDLESEFQPDLDDISSILDNDAMDLPPDIFTQIDADAEQVGGEWEEPVEYQGSIGRTMFDTPSSEDNSIIVLLPRDTMELVPAQSLVRMHSLPDDRWYLGVVIKGPFAEPDGIRGDAPIVVTTTVKGGIFMPKFHGRVHVEMLGEELNGAVVPPRFRPLPNSPVFVLDSGQTEAVLKLNGDINLGLAIGHENLPVSIPSNRKSVLPRHLGILGTTGGGKSTTVSGLINNFQQAGMATVLIDTEGEYTQINNPTEDPTMISALERRGLSPVGVQNTRLYHLVGRDTTNFQHPSKTEFCLQFSSLSPYVVMELLDLPDAQEQRFLKAFDITKKVLGDLGISPVNDEEKSAFIELDEMEQGYPRMTLANLIDIVQACERIADKSEDNIKFYSQQFRSRIEDVLKSVKQVFNGKSDNVPSWRGLWGKLARIARLRIFDNQNVKPIDFQELTTAGRVSIIDLSDTDSPIINNLVIAELLRGLRNQQDSNYEEAEKANVQPVQTMIVIEEAHEFLSSHRVKQMPILFEQVATIAKRGRKRWLGLTFVTQLPQHLPDEVLGLVNNFILHKISDAGVVNRLKRSIGGIDEGLWSRLPSLAPGQAIVSMTSMTRPLMVAIDPTPCKLRMVD